MASWVDSGQTSGTYFHPGRLFITADGKHLYSVNNNGTLTNGVTAHTRDQVTGALTRLDALTPMCTGYGPQYLVESPDAAHIYVGFGSTSEIKTYNRNATTGALTSFGAAPNITVGTSNSNGGILCMAPDGAHIYAAAYADSKVYCFARDSNSGSGTYGKVTSLTGQASITPTGCVNPYHLVITKNGSSGIAGKYLYVGSFTTTSPQVSCLVRDNNSGSGTYGQLSINPAQASIASPTGQPAWLCVSPDDRHLYVACDKGAVTAYSINQSDGSLTQLANYTSTSAGPWCVQVSPDGTNVYVAASDNCLIDQFTRDNNPASGTFGQLTPKVPSKVRASPYYSTPAGSIGPNWIAISPDGRHLYVPSDLGLYPISQFNIHP